MNTRALLSVTFAGAMSLALGGCLTYGSDRAPAPVPPSSSYTPPTTTTGVGEMLQGSMGNVQGFASAAPEMQIRAAGSTSAYVRLDALNTGSHWWAMTALTINGGLVHPSLQPGAHFSFTSHDAYAGASALRVSAVGCSGPARGNYTYDHGADRVDVDVMPGSTPATNLMVFTAYFTNGSAHQTVQGSFEYTPR